MPLVSAVSYVPVLMEFLPHWGSVDAALAEPLVTKEGGRAEAQALLAELKLRQEGVISANHDLLGARWEQQTGRTAVRRHQEQFQSMVRGYWEGTPWEELLPPLPVVGAALDKYLKPCRWALELWQELEGEPLPPGAPVPLKIGGTVARADYAAEVEALRVAGLAVEKAEFSLALARSKRNAVMRKIRAMLMSYTKALPGRVDAGHVLLLTMPRLWPLPGHTPEAVEATGAWVAEIEMARLTWAASGEAEIDHYQIRSCAGEDYKKEDERVVATIPPDGERLLETAEGLTQPGAAMSFRIYVVLKTGNEKGSKTVTVTRPGEI